MVPLINVHDSGKRWVEGDQFKVNMGEKKLSCDNDIEMYLTLLDNDYAT